MEKCRFLDTKGCALGNSLEKCGEKCLDNESKLPETLKDITYHHPYCQETYKNRGSTWSCVCDTIKRYEEWKVGENLKNPGGLMDTKAQAIVKLVEGER